METKSEYIILNLELDQNYSTTSQEKGNGIKGNRIIYFEKPKVKELREAYEIAIRKCMRLQKMTAPRLKGPVEMEVFYYYGTKDKKKLKQFYRDTKPDCDNINKLLQDVLADFHFFDKGDAQVARLIFSKCWDHKPHIVIRLKELRVNV